MNLTAIIERYRNGFEYQYRSKITRQMSRAIDAVLDCRSERYGEMLLHCLPCDNQQSYFHACGHRSCHRCQNHDTTRWLERQTQKLLPVEYFMVTFTLPYELRAFTWHHQKSVYSILFECAVATLKQFGINDKKLGSELAMTAVLHTHTRRLDYHPHLHIVYGCTGAAKHMDVRERPLLCLVVALIKNGSNGINSKVNTFLMSLISQRFFAPSFWQQYVNPILRCQTQYRMNGLLIVSMSVVACRP